MCVRERERSGLDGTEGVATLRGKIIERGLPSELDQLEKSRFNNLRLSFERNGVDRKGFGMAI